jgi:hypothetical protein
VLLRLSPRSSAPIALAIAVTMIGTTVPQPASAAGRKSGEALEEEGFVDPRFRQPPARHRFRLGLQLEYIRLSAALDERDMSVTRYHYLPLAIDAAYQLQFAKYLMLRPSLAFGANVFNTTEAMPLVIHPQLHAGYQGSMFGVALGYGFFTPPIRTKDARSEIRDDPGQPVILNNHHIGAEVSLTTRIDRGALSFQFRFAGVTSRTQHFELDRRRWRPMIMFNIGWYFGDGRRAAERRRQRQAERRER